MCIQRRPGKPVVAVIHGQFFPVERNRHRHVHEPPAPAEAKKPDTEEYVLDGSIHRKFKNKQN